MFENIIKFFKKAKKDEKPSNNHSKSAAKERLHLVLMQDRANVSADFLDLMKQEIIDVIKKYIEVDENAIDVRLTNKENEDGTNGAPALYANIPIITIKNEARKMDKNDKKQENNKVVEEEKTENNSDNSLEKENTDNKVDNQEEKNEEIAEVISEAEEIKENNQEIIIEEAEVSVENKEEDNKEENKETENSTADNN